MRPLSPMRKTIARRLTESKTTVPHFYLTIDVDAAELVKLREQINAELAAQRATARRTASAQPLKVSLNDLLVKACAVALVRVPECNASFTPEAILVHRRVDISVAVAIPDGLVTPVVRDADQKSVVAIAREVRELASRARARKLKPEEMQDGTFSISNLGMFGIDEFAAVINPPEGAILAVGQVRDVPVVHDGAVVAGQAAGDDALVRPPRRRRRRRRGVPRRAPPPGRAPAARADGLTMRAAASSRSALVAPRCSPRCVERERAPPAAGRRRGGVASGRRARGRRPMACTLLRAPPRGPRARSPAGPS